MGNNFTWLNRKLDKTQKEKKKKTYTYVYLILNICVLKSLHKTGLNLSVSFCFHTLNKFFFFFFYFSCFYSFHRLLYTPIAPSICNYHPPHIQFELLIPRNLSLKNKLSSQFTWTNWEKKIKVIITIKNL